MAEVLLLQQAVEDVLDLGWGVIDFDSLGLEKEVIKGFLEFLKEPDEYKDTWTIDILGDGDPDDGFVRRRGGGYDYKSFFHYRPTLHKYLQERSIDFTRYQEWLKVCQELFQCCFHAIYKFCFLLNHRLPLFDFTQSILEPQALCQRVLRLLHYEQSGDRVSGSIIAKPHFDRDFLTLHLAECSSGLRLGPERILYQTEPGKALIFPGKKAESATSGRIKALEHDVIDTDPLQNRWSIVFFSHINISPE